MTSHHRNAGRAACEAPLLPHPRPPHPAARWRPAENWLRSV